MSDANFIERSGTHGVEQFETPPYVNGPSGAGPSGPEGVAAQMPPNAAGRYAGLGGPSDPESNRFALPDALDTLQPSGPSPVLRAPGPGAQGAFTGGTSMASKLAQLAQAAREFFRR